MTADYHNGLMWKERPGGVPLLEPPIRKRSKSTPCKITDFQNRDGAPPRLHARSASLDAT
jgi:hypothetical protein